MGWSHADISLDDLKNLIKGFIDILILAPGYQSTGRLAHWDSHNIKKAFHWALFFENVFERFKCSDNYQECIQELDAFLSELKSSPQFPQGLGHVSAVTLAKARTFLFEHLVQTLPLREEHLRALMTAAVEMDFDYLKSNHSDYRSVLLEKLLCNASISMAVPKRKLFVDYPAEYSTDNNETRAEDCLDDTFSSLAVQELKRRQSVVSLVSAAEKGLCILLGSIGSGSSNDLEEGKLRSATMTEERPIDPDTWSRWRVRSLSYFLNNRTIRLLSGVSLLYSNPKSKWIHVFDDLGICTESPNYHSEKLEILLLGCISSRWVVLLQRLMSSCYQSLAISNLYQELQNILPGRHGILPPKQDLMDPKEKEVLEYLEVSISNQFHHLWKLSPVLAAIAIPAWSKLFRSYISALESQMRGEPSTIRCCNCPMDKEHRECEVAERVWCLYTFHVVA